MNKTTSLAASALMLSACAAPQTPEPPENTAHKVGLANPASVYCIQQGGKLRMTQTPQGTHAMCILPNGQAIEEWEYFRKNHS
ncbi:MAG TPA: DUF333 domain-containing protein, partial [Comamonas sp.]